MLLVGDFWSTCDAIGANNDDHGLISEWPAPKHHWLAFLVATRSSAMPSTFEHSVRDTAIQVAKVGIYYI